MPNYVDKPTVARMFYNNKKATKIEDKAILFKGSENISIKSGFGVDRPSIPDSIEDIHYTEMLRIIAPETDEARPTEIDIQESLKGRSTVTLGDSELFENIDPSVRVGFSAVDVIARGSKAEVGIVQIGDNIDVTELGLISVPNASDKRFGVVKQGENVKIEEGVISIDKASKDGYGVVKIGKHLTLTEDGSISVEEGSIGSDYVHPDTHPASMIETDDQHMFITKAQLAELSKKWSVNKIITDYGSGVSVYHPDAAGELAFVTTTIDNGDSIGALSVISLTPSHVPINVPVGSDVCVRIGSYTKHLDSGVTFLSPNEEDLPTAKTTKFLSAQSILLRHKHNPNTDNKDEVFTIGLSGDTNTPDKSIGTLGIYDTKYIAELSSTNMVNGRPVMNSEVNGSTGFEFSILNKVQGDEAGSQTHTQNVLHIGRSNHRIKSRLVIGKPQIANPEIEKIFANKVETDGRLSVGSRKFIACRATGYDGSSDNESIIGHDFDIAANDGDIIGVGALIFNNTPTTVYHQKDITNGSYGIFWPKKSSLVQSKNGTLGEYYPGATISDDMNPDAPSEGFDKLYVFDGKLMFNKHVISDGSTNGGVVVEPGEPAPQSNVFDEIIVNTVTFPDPDVDGPPFQPKYQAKYNKDFGIFTLHNAMGGGLTFESNGALSLNSLEANFDIRSGHLIDIYAGSQVNLTAANHMFIQSDRTCLIKTSGYLELDTADWGRLSGATGVILKSSRSSIDLEANAKINLTAKNAITLQTTDSVLLNGSKNVNVTTSNMNLIVTGAILVNGKMKFTTGNAPSAAYLTGYTLEDRDGAEVAFGYVDESQAIHIGNANKNAIYLDADTCTVRGNQIWHAGNFDTNAKWSKTAVTSGNGLSIFDDKRGSALTFVADGTLDKPNTPQDKIGLNFASVSESKIMYINMIDAKPNTSLHNANHYLFGGGTGTTQGSRIDADKVVSNVAYANKFILIPESHSTLDGVTNLEDPDRDVTASVSTNNVDTIEMRSRSGSSSSAVVINPSTISFRSANVKFGDSPDSSDCVINIRGSQLVSATNSMTLSSSGVANFGSDTETIVGAGPMKFTITPSGTSIEDCFVVNRRTDIRLGYQEPVDRVPMYLYAKNLSHSSGEVITAINSLMTSKFDNTGGTINGNATITGDLVCNNDIVAFSDANLKDNITPIGNGLDKVTKLKGVSFKWKTNDKVSCGLIAQDVESVLPEAVTEHISENNGEVYKGVNYAGVVGLLVESIKELKAEIDELKSIIQGL